MMIRKPAAAGTFYPNRKEELEIIVNNMLSKVPNQNIEDVKALVVPHAGYIYSGQVAAYGYALLERYRNENMRYIILGPSHYVYLDTFVGDGNDQWATPIGNVPLAQNGFEKSNVAHMREHCIEVQLPFLQAMVNNFEIMPILAGEMNAKDLAKQIMKVLDKKSFLIISSDLSHYKGYEAATTIDSGTIAAMEKLDYNAMEKQGDACGKTPLLAAIEIARHKKWKCKMLTRRNSGDVAGDKRSVVGYASFAFY
jgi:MEMO1 family protein